MTSVSWKNNISGNWGVAANWSTGVKPGATDDVTISTASAQTITHNTGTDSIASLFVNSDDTLAVTGGTLTVKGNAALNGAFTESAGTFKVAGTNSQISGTVTQTAGTLQVASGWLHFTGTGNSFAGTLSGAGVDFASGSDTLNAGLKLTAGNVLISGATVTLAQSFTDAGTWTQTGGTLALGGKTLTLSGAVSFDGGVINGAGTVAVKGSGEISSLALEGSAVLSNSAALTQTGNWYLGYNGTDTSKLVNQAGATFTIANSSNIFGTAGTTLSNAGTLIKSGGGDSQIREATTNTGTITVASGTLSFGGNTNSFAGTIGGPGGFELYAGTDTFNTGLALTVGSVLLDGANLTLGASLTYGGNWTQTTGTLALGGKTLNLTGIANFDGGVINGAGTIAAKGSGEISSLALEGSALLSNSAALTQTGSWYLGYNGTDTSKLVNQAGATFTIANSSNIYGTAGASLNNAGTLIKSGGGDSQIREATTNTGTITVASGTLSFGGGTNSFAGTIGGPGGFELYAGIDTFNTGLALTVGSVLLDGASLTLGASLTYGGNWTQTGGTLALGGKTLNLTGIANFDGGVINGAGTVAVKGTGEISSLALEGSSVLSNGAALTQTGSWYLGYNGTDTSQLVNKVGATFTIANSSNIYGTAGTSLNNAGTLIKSGGGGLSGIAVATTNTGTITVASGTLRFSGSTNSFAGTIGGPGQVELYAGTDTFNTGLALTVDRVLLDGASLTLGASLTYGGNWTHTGGTLALGGKTLNLTGTANFDGGIINGAGTVAVKGSGEISSLALEGSSVLSNGAALTQTGNWYLGYNGTDTSKLLNKAGATFTIANNATIFGTAGATLNNAGTLIKSGGSGLSSIAVATSNTGVIEVSSGSMSFLGQVSGTGTFDVGAGTALRFGAAVAAGTTVNLGSNADLTVQATAAFGGKIAGFATGDLIDLAGLGFGGTSLSFNATTDKLTLTNGTFSTSLQLVGSYHASDFYVFSDQGTAAIGHV